MVPRRRDESSSFHLDEVDQLIIEQLQEDGRRSYGRIGKVVGLSEAAVRQRVQRLVEAEVIKIVAVTDPEVLGFRLSATVGVHVEGDLVAVADRVAAIPEVDYAVSTAGSFDLLVELRCEDDSHLFSVLNEGIRTIPGVRRTETFIYLRIHKQTYPWPPSKPASKKGRTQP
jgi:Lrp/AsnC family transcriptional regulator for asnA, asnC and gidA